MGADMQRQPGQHQAAKNRQSGQRKKKYIHLHDFDTMANGRFFLGQPDKGAIALHLVVEIGVGFEGVHVGLALCFVQS